MSIQGYSISKGKTKFQIHLSSTQVNNYTGNEFDARYTVDLRNHVDVSDMSKPYLCSVSFRTNGSDDPVLTDLYGLHLDIGSNSINAHAYKEGITPHTILKVESFSNGGVDYVSVYSEYQTNSPLFVKTLFNVDTIAVNVLKINGMETVAWPNTNYHMILYFEEV
jgi:hypothetical protein